MSEQEKTYPQLGSTLEKAASEIKPNPEEVEVLGPVVPYRQSIQGLQQAVGIEIVTLGLQIPGLEEAIKDTVIAGNELTRARANYENSRAQAKDKITESVTQKLSADIVKINEESRKLKSENDQVERIAPLYSRVVYIISVVGFLLLLLTTFWMYTAISTLGVVIFIEKYVISLLVLLVFSIGIMVLPFTPLTQNFQKIANALKSSKEEKG